MQQMQEQAVTPRGFLQDLGPNDDVKAWTRSTLQERNSSASRISREEVLRGIREEQERKRILTQPLDVGDMPTLYNVPAIRSPYTTEKLAHILAPQEEIEEYDPCVQITASANHHTVDLIHSAVEQLGSTPTLIVVSNLRWMAHGKLLKRLQYHYQGVRVPIVPSDGPCDFDIKVYGCKI